MMVHELKGDHRLLKIEAIATSGVTTTCNRAAERLLHYNRRGSLGA